MTTEQPEKRFNRRTAIKGGVGALTVAGAGGLGLYFTTSPALALETDDAITADNVTLANNEQEVTDVTLQPSFDLDYENFSGGIDEIDFDVIVTQVLANVTTDPGVNATTLVTDWHKDSASGDYVAYESGTSTDGGVVVSEANHTVETSEAINSVGETIDLDATAVISGATAGMDETAFFTGTASLVSNLTDMVVDHYPGGGTSTAISDDEAGVSEVTLDYTVTLRDTDNGVTNTDTETATYYVIIDNPATDTDTSGTSGTGATGE